MPQAYPYQDAFNRLLNDRSMAAATRDEYTATLTDFFHYLENFNPTYERTHQVNQLQTQDVDQYLSMLLTARQIQNQTYNKILSHLNVYFKFLFSHGWTPYLPTLDLKSKPKQAPQPLNYQWVDDLDALLADGRLHVYTRLPLLLVAQGYPVQSFLKPGVTAKLAPATWPAAVQPFLQTFREFITPLQQRFACDDWFLKQRAAADPHLTLPGLHKYLKPDETLVGFALSPTVLYQGYLVNYLRRHPQKTDSEVIAALNLPPDSIDYYRRLSQRAD